ncbi:UbiA family prenyltransferase [Granulicella sp. 5B5]|uniref:UbiA family prenyltransferase n=1 Tax=Granulicella sp. 5B5 TaxID=1617967 RepID=UPI0015F40A49|nr:UbiA family prenyltransferase [Granulicella sp. 5B5]QMV18677.1 UbiA family prenyltransferase [Granulicella sp. 5B5]
MQTKTTELQNIVGIEVTGQPLPASDCPLCVDLDGTLVKSDTLIDSVLYLARHRPGDLVRIPRWLAQGKAAFKRHVTNSVTLDVETLPYNQPLLAYLQEQHATGRTLYLATAADTALAERIAAHLGIFQGVLASDGSTNLAGGNKLAAFREAFGENFSYIGNASPDGPILISCQLPMVANPDRALLSQLREARITPAETFTDRSSPLRGWLRAIRLHQWAKNTLIFVPMLLAHQWALPTLVDATIAFFSFGLCASSTYIVNDLLDIDADRRHPTKRKRAFASGDVSAISGVVAIALLFTVAIVLAIALPHVHRLVEPNIPLERPYQFLKWLLFYTATTLCYSLYLKRKLLLDVFVLSGLYTVRILAGSAATAVAVSTWLAGFSVFFFLSLAFVKRFSELYSLRERGGVASSGRGYHVDDLEQLRALGTGSAYAAVVVMTLYISNPETHQLYHHPIRLWLVVPALLLWLSNIWMLTSRGEMHDDPVVFAITDKRSLLLGVVMACIIVSAL